MSEARSAEGAEAARAPRFGLAIAVAAVAASTALKLTMGQHLSDDPQLAYLAAVALTGWLVEGGLLCMLFRSRERARTQAERAHLSEDAQRQLFEGTPIATYLRCSVVVQGGPSAGKTPSSVACST